MTCITFLYHLNIEKWISYESVHCKSGPYHHQDIRIMSMPYFFFCSINNKSNQKTRSRAFLHIIQTNGLF